MKPTARMRRGALAAALAGVTLLASAASAAATPGGPTCNVSGGGGADYTTIAAALSDAGCTTINVAAGSYGEGPLSITHNVTIRGPNADRPAGSARVAAAVISSAGDAFRVNAADLTVTITGLDLNASANGVNTVSAGTNLTVTNNSFRPGQTGILLSNAFASVSGNIFDHETVTGIRVQGNQSSATITGNLFMQPAVGVTQASGAAAIHFNRFLAGSGAGVAASGAVDAENNWFGCNAGPGGSGCATTTGPVDADPWLVLGVSAVGQNPGQACPASVSADLNHNSAGTDISSQGTVHTGIPVSVASDTGNFAQSSGTLSAGRFDTVLNGPCSVTPTVSATVDGQTAQRVVAVTPVPSQGGADLAAPVLSSLTADPRTFAVDPKGKAEKVVKRAKKRKVKKGTTFRYRLSEAARVVFTIERKGKGRKVGKTCKKQTTSNRKRKACTRFTRVGAFVQQASAGKNAKKFSGRIGKTKLSPGNYRVTLVATDAAGNRSKAKRVAFKVVKP